MEAFGRTNRTKFRNQMLNPLLNAGWLEMTLPEKPSSKFQQYRITPKGRDILDIQKKNDSSSGDEVPVEE